MQALSPPRPISPARTGSPLNPLTHPRRSTQPIKTKTNSTNTRTHLSNLEHLLQKQSQVPPPLPNVPSKAPSPIKQPDPPPNPNSLLNALNLSSLFPRNPPEEMSPRSLTHLHRLLSDSPGPSPRNTIASRWRQFHGANDWAGLLDPLNEDLRRELVRYGDLVQSAYHAFHSNAAISPVQHRPVPLPDRNYRVVRSLFATSSIDVPEWIPGVAPLMTQRSSWIGYIAVCDNELEINRVGRRDIVIALRGTATCLEWAENFRAGLVPIEVNGSGKNKQHVPKVEQGFLSLFKTPGANVPSLSAAVVEEVRKLMEQYRGEELSITVTGHSLGAALAVLVADEISACAPHVPPVAVFSFGGPRVGNQGFADRVERRDVKVLRVVNAHDVITRVPGVLPHVIKGMDGYAHVGKELRVDSRVSPYLRPDADPACCHDLEAYLHLVDGFMGSNCPFRSNAKRSLVRLLNQQGANVKQKYMCKARNLGVDPGAPVPSNVQGCLASPS